MKGILLAGGKGTRLHPLTIGTNKQLLPVYNKPLVYYPLSVLMLAGIREILVISSRGGMDSLRCWLQDGSQWGLRLEYALQEEPLGLADSFRIGRDFVDQSPVCLILGDNIFYGRGLPQMLREAAQMKTGAIVFACPVKDPQRYGVIELDSQRKPLHIEEKPSHPRSNLAVTGIYFYGPDVVPLADQLQPSARGELEITDINRIYLEQGRLQVRILGRGVAWMDAGTHDSLLQASNFVAAVELRQGLMVSCPEEIAYRMGNISAEELHALADSMGRSDYGEYLLNLVREDGERVLRD